MPPENQITCKEYISQTTFAEKPERMKRILKVYFLGWLISFLGSLPLGTLNITAFHIAALENIKEALLFALAVVLVEVVVVRITLGFSNTINLKSRLFSYTLPVAITLLLYLAISSFLSSNDHTDLLAEPYLFSLIRSSFLLGLLLSITNPMHIPFWMTWNGVLIEKRTLDNGPGMYPSYLLGIGLGSIAGLMPFIFAGKYIFQEYRQFSFVIALGTGSLYLIFTVYLVSVFYRNHVKLWVKKRFR